MEVWLLNPYGPLPDEGWRKYRNILVGEELASSGTDVTWFASRFSHHFKRNREGEGYQTNLDNFKVSYIETRSYSNNIGIGRIIFEISYCINAYIKLRNLDSPEVIIATDPSQFVGMLARKLAKLKNSYLILDMMDEWPELFEKALPKKFRIFSFFPVMFFKRLRQKNYNSADGVIALGSNYYRLALSLATNTEKGALIYNGIDCKEFDRWAKTTSVADLLPRKSESEVWCVYAGSLGLQGDNYDIPAILEAALYFSKGDSMVKFIIAGAGAGKELMLDFVSKNKLQNLLFLGNLLPEQLAAVYRNCDIGMAVYGSGSNVDMPDKFYDYTVSGLALISSLTGEAREFIERDRVGITYKANDHFDFIQKLEFLISDRDRLMDFKIRSSELGKVFDQGAQYGKLHELIRKIQND
jgi:glycosyltransferase involved in cell wall biosynthesis